ncbi:MAG: hypothetical protein HOG61_04205 [Nitrospina sp.]|nr:hypothetical protein [Nitrospina sp.]
MRIKFAIIPILMLAQVCFFSKAEAGDEEYHKQILEALKRMNVRLVRIETNKIRSLKAVQESLLNQIMALRTSLEQIQATGEMNKVEMLAAVGGMKTKILDVESHLKNEVMNAVDAQNQEDKRYRAKFQALFNELKDSLATDMESFSKVNQQQFQNFGVSNDKQLQKIVSVFEEQNSKLLQTQALFKTDLIPALDTQSEETRQALLTELSQARVIQKNFLESNHKQTVATLATIQEKNKGLIEILKKIILVDEATKMALDKGLLEVKNNQKTASSQLNTLLVGVSDQIQKHSTQMKESVKQSSKIEKNIQQSLISATSQVNQNSSLVEKNINKAIDVAASNAKAQSDLSNEKLSRLVDILKSFAVEQGKIDQALQTLVASQSKIEQVLQGQKKLDVVLQNQRKVEKEIQGQGLGSMATQETILTTQKKITDALEDLRRKSNVNISRTEDVLKKLKKQK